MSRFAEYMLERKIQETAALCEAKGLDLSPLEEHLLYLMENTDLGPQRIYSELLRGVHQWSEQQAAQTPNGGQPTLGAGQSWFDYEALTGEGKQMKGRIPAKNEDEAEAQIKAAGYFVTKLRKGGGSSGGVAGQSGGIAGAVGTGVGKVANFARNSAGTLAGAAGTALGAAGRFGQQVWGHMTSPSMNNTGGIPPMQPYGQHNGQFGQQFGQFGQQFGQFGQQNNQNQLNNIKRSLQQMGTQIQQISGLVDQISRSAQQA